MKKIFNIILTFVLLLSLTACNSAAFKENWTQIKYITDYNTNREYKPYITFTYIETETESSGEATFNSLVNKYLEIYSPGKFQFQHNNKIDEFESLTEAIKIYEEQINKYSYRSDTSSGYTRYFKQTITGYKLVTYEVKLYNYSNYLEIKTITFTSDNNETTESITGVYSNGLYIGY
ncbi:hypothetical protein J6Y73_05870 [bacterium]|nr:hypothetical protein [bacterium]